MAKSLASVTLSAPASSGSYGVNATFTMTQQYALSGGGGAPTVELHWQYNQGTGTWIDIPTSGSTGLVASGGSQANATVSTNYSRTITCRSAGTYVIRAWAHASTPKDVYSSNTPTITVGNPPAAPTNAHTDSKTATQIAMHWTDNSSDETGFKVYKNDTYIETIAAGSTSYTFLNLEPNTTYDLAVKATNAFGDSAEAQLTETTLFQSGTTLFESQDADTGNESQVDATSGNPRLSFQTFTPATTHFLYSVKLTLKEHQFAGPFSGNFKVAIYSTIGAYPDTELVSATMNTLYISTTATAYTFTFATPLLVTAGTIYAIVCSCDAGDGYWTWIGVLYNYNTSTDPYANGKLGVKSSLVSGNYYDALFYTLDASDVVHESQTEEDNHVISVFLPTDHFASQSFTASSGYTIKKVRLSVGKVGSPTGTWKVAIKAASSDLPTGSDLCSVTGDIATAWPSSKTLTTFTFSTGYALTSGTKYCIVVSILDGSSYNGKALYVYLKYNASTDPYTGGTSGSRNWIYYGNYNDARFKEYGNNAELFRLNVGDAFKYVDVGALQINIGDAWKQIIGMYINIGDVWKTISGA